MEEAQEPRLNIMVLGDKEAALPMHKVTDQPRNHRNYRRWIRITIYSVFVLASQSAASLLGRQYFNKGGNSRWLSTLVQLAGFPILLPYYCIPPSRKYINSEIIQTTPPSLFMFAAVYVCLGLLIAVVSFLYSFGIRYLPVSTYSLISASQLAFNSFFSFFLNKQKFTPYIINSLVLLTISSTLLIVNKDSGNTTGVAKAKYAIGFTCTVGASAGYGLMLSLTQLAFRRVIKKEDFTAIMDMAIYPSFVASCAAVVGLFASREWMTLKREMDEYELGKVSYVMNLVCSGICWQLFVIGQTGLIFETSSIFSNAISVLGLPIVPVLAVIFFHDKMDGLKVIVMLLAIWGFVSFAYHDYLDGRKSKIDNRKSIEVPQTYSR